MPKLSFLVDDMSKVAYIVEKISDVPVDDSLLIFTQYTTVLRVLGKIFSDGLLLSFCSAVGHVPIPPPFCPSSAFLLLILVPC